MPVPYLETHVTLIFQKAKSTLLMLVRTSHLFCFGLLWPLCPMLLPPLLSVLSFLLSELVPVGKNSNTQWWRWSAALNWADEDYSAYEDKWSLSQCRCSRDCHYLTWTASVCHCSTLCRRRGASWRQCVSCGQSWLRLCLVEAFSTSLVPLEIKEMPLVRLNLHV